MGLQITGAIYYCILTAVECARGGSGWECKACLYVRRASFICPDTLDWILIGCSIRVRSKSISSGVKTTPGTLRIRQMINKFLGTDSVAASVKGRTRESMRGDRQIHHITTSSPSRKRSKVSSSSSSSILVVVVMVVVVDCFAAAVHDSRATVSAVAAVGCLFEEKYGAVAVRFSNLCYCDYCCWL